MRLVWREMSTGETQPSISRATVVCAGKTDRRSHTYTRARAHTPNGDQCSMVYGTLCTLSPQKQCGEVEKCVRPLRTADGCVKPNTLCDRTNVFQNRFAGPNRPIFGPITWTLCRPAPRNGHSWRFDGRAGRMEWASVRFAWRRHTFDDGKSINYGHFLFFLFAFIT